MPDLSLTRCSILIAEDEYMLADELAQELEDLGADVMGPAPTVDAALELVAATATIDGAILDINLGGTLVYPVAETLNDRGVPFVFITGYDPDTIPRRFASFPRCKKPVSIKRLLVTLDGAVHQH